MAKEPVTITVRFVWVAEAGPCTAEAPAGSGSPRYRPFRNEDEVDAFLAAYAIGEIGPRYRIELMILPSSQ